MRAPTTRHIVRHLEIQPALSRRMWNIATPFGRSRKLGVSDYFAFHTKGPIANCFNKGNTRFQPNKDVRTHTKMCSLASSSGNPVIFYYLTRKRKGVDTWDPCMTGVKSNKDRLVKALEENLSKHWKSAKRGHCTRAEQECCIMTD